MNRKIRLLCLLVQLLTVFTQEIFSTPVTSDEVNGDASLLADDQPCGLRPSYRKRLTGKGLINSTRISHGYPATREEFPSYVSVLIQGKERIECSGVIVGSRAILTAGHCLEDMNRAYLNSEYSLDSPVNWPSDRLIEAKKLCAPTQYSMKWYPSYDYGVIVLDEDQQIQFNETVQPACLTTAPMRDGQKGISVGIGFVSKWKKSTQVNAIPMQKVDCRSQSHPTRSCYRAYSRKHLGTLCKGDSGGPHYVMLDGRQTVVGLASYSPTDACDKPERNTLANTAGDSGRRMQRFVQKCINHSGSGLIKIQF